MIAQIQDLLAPVLWGIASLGLVIDVIPKFKARPIRFLFKQVGKLILPDVYKEVSCLQEEVDLLKSKVTTEVQHDLKDLKKLIENLNSKYDKRETSNMRCEIIEFADELRQGVKPTKHRYEKIFRLHDRYLDYIKENNLTNGLIDADYNFILKKYSQRFEKGDKGALDD